MKKTGEILKTRREERKLSLEQIHRALKINLKILKAIESGDLESLPSRSFLRGFVQSYARFLNLEVSQVLEVYQSEMGSARPSLLTHQEEDSDEVTSDEEEKNDDIHLTNSENTEISWLHLGKWSSTVKMATVLGILFIVLAIWIVQTQIKKYSQEARVDNRRVEKIVSNSLPVSEELESSKNIVVDEADKEKKQVEKKDVEKKQVKEVQVNESTKIDKKEEIKKKLKPVAPKNKIVLEALDDLQFEFQVEGEEKKTVFLKADQFYTITGKKRITIRFSDAGVVSVVHNGKYLGVPGQLGQSMEKEYR